MAVTPQMPVPPAINVPRLLDSFSLFVKYKVIIIPLEIQMMISGSPQPPNFSANETEPYAKEDNSETQNLF